MVGGEVIMISWLVLASAIRMSVADLAANLDQLWELRMEGVAGTSFLVFSYRYRKPSRPVNQGDAKYRGTVSARLGGQRWPIKRTKILHLFQQQKLRMLYLYWNGKRIRPRQRGGDKR